MASPWSPPAWMKDSGSLLSGRLIASPQIYRAYALYLLKFIEAYRAQGVDIDAITIQNEPQDPHTDMPSWQEAAVIEDLGPMLEAAHLHTEIFAYDHNWTEASGDVTSTPADETADIDDYPQQVLETPAAQWISGVAFHCYSGDPSTMTAFHAHYPKLKIEETECSGSESSVPANTFDPTGWSATADPPGPTNSCCTGDVAANAVDADASTRFSTGEGQAPGQYLQVDFGKQIRARQVVFDTVVADGAGTGQFTSVNLAGKPVRYVRITLTTADVDNWWSVADVRASG